MNHQPNPLTLLRGPLIIISAASALLAPYVARLSQETLALLGLVLVGLCVSLIDAWICAGSYVRVTLNKHIDKIVLDDVLKAIFDPEVGLIATATASLIGSSFMYSWASTVDQRVRLLQSGLWVSDKEVARNILYQPGGIKFLLPSVLLDWLRQPNEVSEPVLEPAWIEKCHESSDDEDSATALYEDEKHHIRQQERSVANSLIDVSTVAGSGPSSRCVHQHSPAFPSVRGVGGNQSTNMNSPETPPKPPMPHEVLGAIIIENIREKLSTLYHQMPDPTTLSMTGGTAALLLLLQLRSSRRARDIVVNVFQSLTTMGLSSVILASGATLCASAFNKNNGRDVLFGVVRGKVVIEHMKRNWKKWLAVLVLFYLRRRQKSSRRF